ncbi:DNA primase [Patescibacteria group bacterium]|nr:DNA primase [Patescibacteria group bacterium]
MPDSQVEEIKNRLDIVEVVSEYVSNMKQAGGNWKGLCPFHNEKTPSFMVSKDKQIWHCFGCGEGGDVISFVQKIENIEFPEALKILAKHAGVTLRYEDKSLSNQKTKLLDILEAAARFYHYNLLKMSEAETARNYLFLKRTLTEETVEKFFLGYAPNSWDSAIKFLRDKGYSEKDIFLAGLSVKKERGAGYYDRFRARIMFPIRDIHGHVVGFTARIMPEDEKKENAGGKYINTPQTLVYDKSRVIYGLDFAKQEIKKENLAVMVEGNMDVIASYQAGVGNVVASSGTAMTVEQVNLLKRYSPNLAISFDADLAGSTAAMRGIDVALKEGINVKVIMLSPEVGKDPDDYIKKDPNLWREVIANSMAFMDYYIKKTLAALDLRKVEDKKNAAKILLAQVIKIPDKVEQTFYLEKLGNVLGVPEQVLRESLPHEKVAAGSVSPAVSGEKVIVASARNRPSLIAERFIALVFKYPNQLSLAIPYLEPFMFPDRLSAEIYKNLILYYNKSVDKADLEGVMQTVSDDPNEKKYIASLFLLAEKDFAEFGEEEIGNEILQNAKSLREDYIKNELRRVQTEMKRAEENKEFARIKELAEEFNKLINI